MDHSLRIDCTDECGVDRLLTALGAIMTLTDRRTVLRLLAAGAFSSALPFPLAASRERKVAALPNGLRIHLAPTQSSYISAALTLRARRIPGEGGLAHILEHTSFTGAAGKWSSAEIKHRHKTYLHDANATTAPGIIQWGAAFLPRYAPEALELLSVCSLEQKCDAETVASEARVVLQELFLEKYDSEASLKRKFDTELYGRDHPYSRETVDEEIAKAKMAPEKLAAELRDYAETIRLPANMDLFLVGKIDPDKIEPVIAEAFGRFSYAEAPYLSVPRANVTRSHHALTGTSQQLKRPMSEIKFAWNTGVTIADSDLTVLVTLSHYLNDLISKELREKSGDAYSPEVTFKPDGCSGVFTISITSSKDPAHVEANVLEMIRSLKRSINVDDLTHFKDRFEIAKFKSAESNTEVLNCMISRVVEGGSESDCDIGAVSAEQLQDAARKYLPSGKDGYVRVVLRGR